MPDEPSPHEIGGEISLDEIVNNLTMLIAPSGWDIPELRLVIRAKVCAAYSRGYRRGRLKGREEALRSTNP